MSMECTICYNLSDPVTLPCDHEYCKNCISEYIRVKIDDSETLIRCPNENCGTEIPRDEIKDIIQDDDELSKRYNICIEGYDKLFLIKCPKCDAMCRKKSSKNYVQCNSCEHKYCYLCREDHYSDECPNQRVIDDEFDDICQAMDGADLKKCPVCKIIIEKVDGCNSCRCRMCHSKFCFECLALCSDIKKMEEHECSNYDGYLETNSDDEYFSGDEYDHL
jgi:hypothetical protein